MSKTNPTQTHNKLKKAAELKISIDATRGWLAKISGEWKQVNIHLANAGPTFLTTEISSLGFYPADATPLDKELIDAGKQYLENLKVVLEKNINLMEDELAGMFK